MENKNSSVVSLEFLLDRELGSAFNTSSLYDSSACFGGNSSSEAMRACAVAGVGLVCSLWHICSILLF